MHIYERSESGEPSCQYTLFDGQVVQVRRLELFFTFTTCIEEYRNAK